MMRDRDTEREEMVAHLARRGVHDVRVLAAMREVPRERFVDEALAAQAYADSPQPIAEGQTISQPYVVAFMVQAAEIQPDDRVLEIGCGSGYAAAVMSRVAHEVLTIDRHPKLVEVARSRFERLGYTNIETRAGDGTLGWPERAPFDVILVAASGPAVPRSLGDQLAIGGRLVMPVGDFASGQRLLKMTRRSATELYESDLGGVIFVPLIGEEGWREGQSGRSQ